MTLLNLIGNKVEQVFGVQMMDKLMNKLVGSRQVVPEGTAHSLDKMVAGWYLRRQVVPEGTAHSFGKMVAGWFLKE